MASRSAAARDAPEAITGLHLVLDQIDVIDVSLGTAMDIRQPDLIRDLRQASARRRSRACGGRRAGGGLVRRMHGSGRIPPGEWHPGCPECRTAPVSLTAICDRHCIAFCYSETALL